MIAKRASTTRARTFPFDGIRKWTISGYHALDREYIHLDQNIHRDLSGTAGLPRAVLAAEVAHSGNHPPGGGNPAPGGGILRREDPNRRAATPRRMEMTAKARELWQTVREDRRARRKALLGTAVVCGVLAWLSVWLLLVLVYIAGATAVLLRSELLRSPAGDDEDWF